MTRPLPITAAEWASVQGGTVWLVREGTPCMAHGFDPPVEFVQAAAPCVSCEGSRCDLDMCHNCGNEYEEPCARHQDHGSAICDQGCCPDCRIELVGECPRCEGTGNELLGLYRRCTGCGGTGTVTLGHAYAVGSPLPIYDPDDNRGLDAPCLMASTQGVVVFAATSTLVGTIITDRLAHAGPPETLVGKWAMRIELKVVGS